VSSQWEVKVGDLVPVLGRTKAASTYTVTAVDERGFTVARASTGSTVRVTWLAVNALKSRLHAGEAVLFKGSATKGGVDTTSAKRDSILWAAGAARNGDLVEFANTTTPTRQEAIK
jgi:hypothetical protein